MKPDVTFPMSRVAHDMTVHVRVTGQRRFFWRFNIALWIFRIGAWVLPCRCEISQGGDE